MSEKTTIALSCGAKLFTPSALNRLREMGSLVIRESDKEPTPEQVAQLAHDADILITSWGSPNLDEALMAQLPRLRFVAHAAGSVKPIVSDAMWGRGVRVINSAKVLGMGVAETALGLTISGVKNFFNVSKSLADGGWHEAYDDIREMFELKIGVIGGGEGSEITRGHEGFKAGAKSINPGVDIQEVYTGDWNDTTGAYEAAIGMYDSGVDVIWHSGDGIGLGVVQAAEEKDMYVLGNVEDQKSLAPKNVLSGLQYEWANALDRIFTSIRDGSFVSDGEKETYMINVANGGLSMTEINDVKGWLTKDDIAVIEDVYAKLGQDAIELPEV